MKKIQFSCVTAIFFFAVIFLSCNKLDVITPPATNGNPGGDDLKRNEATWVYDNNSKKWLMRLLYFSGHEITQCGNACVKVLGEWGHIDCRGFGDACASSKKVSLSSNGDGFYTLTLEDPFGFGEDLEYQFPERSFFVTNPQNSKELWLNIHEQLLVRDSLNLPFIIQDAWFSEEQELENP
jgi:hypothetical protein